MPWRVIAYGDQVWHVDAVAERPANTGAWQLVLTFRAAAAREPISAARRVFTRPATGAFAKMPRVRSGIAPASEPLWRDAREIQQDESGVP